jgi:hypothetical protein
MTPSPRDFIPKPNSQSELRFQSKKDIQYILKAKRSQQTFLQNMPPCGRLQSSLKFFLLSQQRLIYKFPKIRLFAHSIGRQEQFHPE